MIKKIKEIFNLLYWTFIKNIPWLRPLYETRKTQTPLKISLWFLQRVVGFNRRVYWPVHFTSVVNNYQNILAGIETCPGYMPGCYIQAIGDIYIGDYTQISANVGIITANHDIYDNRKHPDPTTVRIGRYCWIGMNTVILSDVELGDYTIVGAGSVVTKSFPEGYCVIACNPAKIIKLLDRKQCIMHQSEYKYNGYIPNERFEEYRKKYLNV